MGTLHSFFEGGSPEGFLHTSEASRRGIEGTAGLAGTNMIIVVPGEALRCAPELVQPLHSWLFFDGNPPKGWESFRIYQMNATAMEQFAGDPFGKFRFFTG